MAGGFIALPKFEKLRILITLSNQTLGYKAQCQEGNSPDFMLRPLKLNNLKEWQRIKTAKR